MDRWADFEIVTREALDVACARSAGLERRFEALLSADAARAYKPDPAVYQLATDRFGFTPERIGFVTGNGWDTAGAAAPGFGVAWLRAPGAVLPAVPASPLAEASWATVAGHFAPG